MDTVWKARQDWNRIRVAGRVVEAFNGVIEDIVAMQRILPPSQPEGRGGDVEEEGDDGGGEGMEGVVGEGGDDDEEKEGNMNARGRGIVGRGVGGGGVGGRGRAGEKRDAVGVGFEGGGRRRIEGVEA